jgi:hypothetical protein
MHKVWEIKGWGKPGYTHELFGVYQTEEEAETHLIGIVAKGNEGYIEKQIRTESSQSS